MKTTRFKLLLSAVATTALFVGHASAQTSAPAAGDPVLHAAAQPVQTIEITVGESRTLDAAWPVKRVSVADPEVADVDATSPTRVQIRGKSLGLTDIVMENEKGDRWRARLEVSANTSRLQGQLSKLFPKSAIEVAQVDDVVVVKGTLARAEDASQLRALLTAAKVQFLDLTNISGTQQVQLQVKVAEVSRSAVRSLTTDWAFTDFTGGLAVNNGASATYNPTQPIGDFTRSLPGGTTIFGHGAIGSTVFEMFLKALNDNQYLRLLAEPTLVARSGQEAQFLAGGEIPIPIAQVGGGGNTEISIEYKEFGIRLRFTPTVLGNGRIELKVNPEVSQLSDVGAIELLGTRIPSLITRRVSTTLELQTGQTFAIAGLLSQRDTAAISKIPGLGDLPVLGTLFRSVRYAKDDTEMLVLVTASLVEPSSQELNPLVPGQFHQPPNDWELYIEGRAEGRHDVRIAPTQQERLKALGLDKLHGPGAWASHDQLPNNLAGETKSTQSAK